MLLNIIREEEKRKAEKGVGRQRRINRLIKKKTTKEIVGLKKLKW